jgi:hypothetical protein
MTMERFHRPPRPSTPMEAPWTELELLHKDIRELIDVLRSGLGIAAPVAPIVEVNPTPVEVVVTTPAPTPTPTTPVPTAPVIHERIFKATGGNNNSITVFGANWEDDMWQNYELEIVEGAGVGQYRSITSNTFNKLTPNRNFDVDPDNTSVFVLRSRYPVVDYIEHMQVALDYVQSYLLDKQRWGSEGGEPTWKTGLTLTGTTIAFVSGTHKITDSGGNLERFGTGDTIVVSGSSLNDGTYTIATGGVAGEIVVNETLSDEAAGATVTLTETLVYTPGAGSWICNHTVDAEHYGQVMGVDIDLPEANRIGLYDNDVLVHVWSGAAAGPIFIVSPLPIYDCPVAGTALTLRAISGGTLHDYAGRLLIREV